MDAPALAQGTELSRLERLPSELLAAIFERARVTKSDVQSARAHRLLRSNKCGAGIKGFIVDLELGSIHREWTEDPTQHDETLFWFFQSTRALKKLVVTTRGDLAARLLTVKMVAFCFPALEELTIKEVDFDANVTLAAQFRNIGLFTSLKRFKVTVVKNSETISLAAQEAEDRSTLEIFRALGRDVPQCSKVETLKLTEVFHESSEFIVDFLALFNSLTSLEVWLEGPDHDATVSASILKAIDNPARLTRLSIASNELVNAPNLVHDILPRFTALQSIELYVTSFNPALCQVLSRLPKLKKVEMYGYVEEDEPSVFDYTTIMMLLDGQSALSAHSSLTIPAPYNRRGRLHSHRKYTIRHDPATGVAVPSPKWYPSEWPESCSLAQAKEIIELAEARNIELNDDFEYAVVTSELYEQELLWCAAQPRVNLVDG